MVPGRAEDSALFVESPAAIDLEHRAHRAWPAEDQIPLGPWTLRATHGLTNRANSVFTAPSITMDGSAGDVDGLIEAAESFYARRGLPPVFHLSPATWPPALDAWLARRGYLVHQPSEVWVADVQDVIDRTRGSAEESAVPSGAPASGFSAALHISEENLLHGRADRVWLDFAYDEPAGRRAIYHGIVERISNPCAFASIRVNGVPLAIGLGVSDGGWTGVFSMLTAPEQRGRGRARQILQQLGTWALERGDRGLYLQVLSTNTPARRLYGRCGFRLSHGYHYRHRPAGNFG
jgi:GNAT superfamily N-acetyltransferase